MTTTPSIRERLANERDARVQQTIAQQTSTAGWRPTPTQHECDQFAIAQAAGTLPHTWTHQMDGSAIDPKSFDPTPIASPTGPDP
jgi:hypothetical protein